MAKRYILTPQADSDIEEIFAETVRQWGMDRAETYLLDLDEKMMRLAEGNLYGRDCATLLPKGGENLRYYHINRHYLIFRPCSDGIEVLALYHDRMDLPRHLAKLAGQQSSL